MSTNKNIFYTFLFNCIFFISTIFAQEVSLEPVVQTGHSRWIYAIAFSHDGKLLVTGSMDNTAKLWDLETGYEIRTFSGHSGAVFSVSLSPDKKFLATGSDDNTAKLWNLETGAEIYRFARHSAEVKSVCFSPDGKLLATGSNDKTAKLWNLKTGEEIRSFTGHTGDVNTVSFSPDGKYLITGGRDETAKLWYLKTGKEIKTIPWSGMEKRYGIILLYNSSAVYPMDFSTDGKLMLTASYDDTVRLWSMESGKKIRSFATGDSSLLVSVSFSPDKKLFATASQDSAAKIWHIETGKELRSFHGSTTFFSTVSFSPDGKLLAAGCFNGTVKLWNIESGQEIRTLTGQLSEVYAVSFSPNGKYLASGSDDNFARLWNLETSEPIYTFEGHSGELNFLTFSPNNKYLLTLNRWTFPPSLRHANPDGTAKLWDIKSKKEIYTIGDDYKVTSAAFSPEGKFMATGINNNTVVLWNIDTGKAIRSFEGHSQYINSMSFSPDGKLLATGSDDNTIKVWNVETGEEICSFTGKIFRMKSVCFSPSGKLLAAVDWDTAKVWDLNTGKEIRAFIVDSWLNSKSIEFSPDGAYLASVAHNNSAKIFNINTGNEFKNFTGHSYAVTSVDFSHDGNLLATSSADATVKLWEVNTGKQTASLICIGAGDYVAVTPENYYKASKGALKGIAFRMGSQIFPFEQFDLVLNRPDKVLESIGLASPQLIDAYYRAYQKRLKRMKITEQQLALDFHLPEIDILTKNFPYTTTQKHKTFSVRAADSQYLLDRLYLFVNNIPIYGMNGIDLRDNSTKILKKQINLELSNGRNKVQVSVLNEKGIESLKKTFEITYNGIVSKPDLYILAIGVSEYEDSRFNLKWAAKDAGDLVQRLTIQKDRFNKIYTIKILNHNATKENIRNLKTVLKQSRVDDEVVLFLSGHGLLDDRLDYYFCTADIDFDNPSERGLIYEDIEDLLDGIPARKKLLLMDTCHSGEVDKDDTVLIADADEADKNVKSRSFRGVRPISKSRKLGLKNSFQLMQELFANLSRGSGAMVIAAAGGAEYAYEGQEVANGLFTHCVLQGLQSRFADSNNDGKIIVSELRDYVIARVQELTRGRQTPASRRENLEFDYELARYKRSSLYLRHKFIELSENEAKKMIIKYKFYDYFNNPDGAGFANQFEIQKISGDKIVIDRATGLMWQQGGSRRKMSFDNAELWIKKLNRKGYAGYHDWRLPTLEEAMSLMEPEEMNKDMHIDPRFDRKQKRIWASDIAGTDRHPYQSWFAWMVYFNLSGSCGLEGKSSDTLIRVRAVRSVQ